MVYSRDPVPRENTVIGSFGSSRDISNLGSLLCCRAIGSTLKLTSIFSTDTERLANKS